MNAIERLIQDIKDIQKTYHPNGHVYNALNNVLIRANFRLKESEQTEVKKVNFSNCRSGEQCDLNYCDENGCQEPKN